MDDAVIASLVDRARLGDERALSELFELHRPRLTRMVELRLDTKLRRRLDPGDVVQEAWLETARRFPQWRDQTGLDASALPIHVWLRMVTAQALAQAQRRHLSTRKREAVRDVAANESRPSVSAANAADAFIASATSPTQAVRRDELRARVLAALEELDEIDREIVALRHFEGLSNDDVAAELSITTQAASKRFTRALMRLRPALQSLASEGSGENK
jgi:RNA polymerase sigma-70 factor (ECF subfamily)